jgi:hypothetical protein
VILAASIAVCAGAFAPLARAQTYSSASIVSISPDAQFDVADSPVVSADGHFVAFRGTVDGHTGIWRRDLQTGRLDPVAIDLPGVQFPSFDPQAPSINADGRYVAFNTQSALDPVNDTTPAPRPWNVYVRDMNVQATAPGAYMLASAVNGGTQALSYGGTPSTGARVVGGAVRSAVSTFASAGGAITADGRSVVFSVDSPSNLVDPTTVSTPAGQVAVRNLATKTTTLVSVLAGSPPGSPVTWSGGAVADDDAVISGDGSTVAWLTPLGALAQESRTLPGEESLFTNTGGFDVQAAWRRIADGPGAPTLRVTGAVDSLRSDCPPGATLTAPGNLVPPNCQGPLSSQTGGFQASGLDFSHLELSGDGYKAVVLSPDELIGAQNGGLREAYLVDMHPGLTRDQATRALTQAVAFSSGSAPGEDNVVADAISADGRTITLSTDRTRFDLASPTYIGPGRPTIAGGNELYVLDLAANTLDLVTYGYNGSFASYGQCQDGQDTSGGLTPSLSSDGSLVLFDSCAQNLVWGDGNNASNVYDAAKLAAFARSAPGQVTGTLPTFVLATPWLVHATAKLLSNGTVELDILVPSRGRILAQARARVRDGKRMRTRTVSTARALARHEGLVRLALHLDRRYLSLARRAGGLRASVSVAFRASGPRGPLKDTVSVIFHGRSKKR